MLFLPAQNVSGKYFALKLGIYDFTSEASRDFYSTAPLFLVSTNIVELARLDFNLTAGIAYNRIKYNNTRHTLRMFPAFFSMVYNLPNVGSKFQPFFGSGIGFMAKFDKNEWLPAPHVNYTYGYHILTGFNIPINKRLTFGFTMQYNAFTPPDRESIDVSGVIHTFELKYNLGKLLKKVNK